MHVRLFIYSLIRIFEVNLQDTCARSEKYSSKLDIISLAYSYLCHDYVTRQPYTTHIQILAIYNPRNGAMHCKHGTNHGYKPKQADG